MKLIILTSTGKSGCRFLQRHFEGHPFIISLPFSFNYYHYWNKLLTTDDTLSSFLRKLLEETPLSNILSHISEEDFLLSTRTYLSHDFQLHEDRKELLVALHLSYNLHVIKNKRAKSILLNMHDVCHLNQIKKDWPKHKHIFLIRDPKMSYASHIDHDIKKECYNSLSFISHTLHNEVYSNIFRQIYPDQIKFLKIEEIDEDLKTSMRTLCKWLEVSYSDSLLIEGVSNENQKPVSKRSAHRYQKNSPEWEEFTSPKEVALIEYVHHDLINEYYQFTSSSALRSKVMTRLLILLPDFKGFLISNKTWATRFDYIKGLWWFKLRIKWLEILSSVEKIHGAQLIANEDKGNYQDE